VPEDEGRIAVGPVRTEPETPRAPERVDSPLDDRVAQVIMREVADRLARHAHGLPPEDPPPGSYDQSAF
jgi:hypothetical protein